MNGSRAIRPTAPRKRACILHPSHQAEPKLTAPDEIPSHGNLEREINLLEERELTFDWGSVKREVT